MANYWNKQPSSRILLSQATAITTALANISGNPANRFSSETWQIRLASTLPVWFATGDSSALAAAAGVDNFLPANTVQYFTVTPGQTLAFISTSTSTGYLSISEMA